MVRIKPFRGIRPPKNYAAEVASRPYDVLNSVEAKAEATERSLLHIIKPEIDFDPIADEHDPKVYEKAVENFRLWRERGWLVQDPEEYYYVYAQTMDGRTQYGLAMCCHFEDYLSGAIKKHELTRTEKEEDRMIHVRNQKANIEPVFFAYPDNAEIDAIVADVVANNAPEYDFTAEDGFGHKPRPEDERPHHGDLQGHPGALRCRRTPPYGRRGARRRGVPRPQPAPHGRGGVLLLPGRNVPGEPAAHH